LYRIIRKRKGEYIISEQSTRTRDCTGSEWSRVKKQIKQRCEVELSGKEEKIAVQKGIKESRRESNGIDHTRLNFIRQKGTSWNKTGWNNYTP
jgi:hypothetical protein